MNSPARLLQKKSTDNGSTHSSWVLRTNLPFAHVVWQTGKNCHFVCVRLTPRSRRYLNITPSPGVLSLSGLRFHTSLTCTALMVTLLTPPRLSEAQPQGFLPHSSGAACTSRERSLPATHIRCQVRWDFDPCFGRGQQALEVSPGGRMWGGAVCLPTIRTRVGRGLLTRGEPRPSLPREWSSAHSPAGSSPRHHTAVASQSLFLSAACPWGAAGWRHPS